MKKFRKIPLLLTVYLFFSTSPVYSALVSIDLDSVNDGLLTLDTRTNLEWLDLSITGRNSVNNMLNGTYGRNFIAEGFILASYDQIIGLFTSVGITAFGVTQPSTINDAGADLLAKYGLFPENGMSTINGMAAFVFGQSGGSKGTSRYLSMDNRNALSASVWPGYRSGFQLGIRNSTVYPDDLGFVLVRQAASIPSLVPVPSAVWLFGSGLLGLIGAARCKRA